MKEFLSAYAYQIATILFAFLMYLRTGSISKAVKSKKIKTDSLVETDPTVAELDSLIEFHRSQLEKLEKRRKGE